MTTPAPRLTVALPLDQIGQAVLVAVQPSLDGLHTEISTRARPSDVQVTVTPTTSPTISSGP